MIHGWNHPATAQRYERFCLLHARYHEANRHLVEWASLQPGHRALDIAAGTGRTAEQALAAGARVVCWEPAKAMRALGRHRLPGAAWRATLPLGLFDRVLCGAAAWQWQPFSVFASLAADRLRPGGALCFNVPSLYLGIPDEPGGGRDPLLLELASKLANGAVPQAPPVACRLSVSGIESVLAAAGLEPERWTFRVAVSQRCLIDWLRIPVLTDALFPDSDAGMRDARIDEASRLVDLDSWKWEGWTGWTAWKR